MQIKKELNQVMPISNPADMAFHPPHSKTPPAQASQQPYMAFFFFSQIQGIEDGCIMLGKAQGMG
jgi:hypothetical protein